MAATAIVKILLLLLKINSRLLVIRCRTSVKSRSQQEFKAVLYVALWATDGLGANKGSDLNCS